VNENVLEKVGIINSKATFDKLGKHRYVLERVWDKDSSKAMVSVVLFNPSYANEILYDYTSMKVINYLINQNKYRGVYILNLYSIITRKSEDVKSELKLADIKENNNYIELCFKKSKKIYIAWGSNEGNIRRVREIINILKNNKFNEVYKLVDKDGKSFHPSRCNIVDEESISLESILDK
jgi:hypothetical protein